MKTLSVYFSIFGLLESIKNQRMKKIFTLLILSSLFLSTSIAQRPLLTLEDVVNGGENYDNLRPESLKSLQWADSDRFSYVKDDTLIVSQSISGKEEVILTHASFKALAFDCDKSTFPKHQWHNEVIEFQLPNRRLFYNTSDESSWQISYPENAQNISLNYDSRQLAYTIDNNLYYATPEDDTIAITTAPDTGIVCGQAVHRFEFGIRKGIFWSDAGDKMAFYHKDESMVKDYPLVNINARQATVKKIKYPMAGMKSHHVSIGIYNVSTQNTIYLETGLPKEKYLTNIAWSPDAQTVYVAEINRGQDTMHFNSYDANTGLFIKTLFTETDEQYVEPQKAMSFLPNDPTKFIWESRRDGYNHLYLYNTNGDLLKQLTKGAWEVTEVLGFDRKVEKLFVSTTKKSYLERHTYMVDITSEDLDIKRLTTNTGVHKSLLSPDGKLILDTWSDIEIPLVTDLISTKSFQAKNIFTANNPYSDYKLGKTKLFTIPSVDSSLELSCRMILPPNFDRTKKYPTVIYVYGGPHSQLIKQSWKGNVQMWQHYMAQQGYIMFTLDNRGTSYRGADFEQVIHQELGKYEMQDQMKGYKYLTSKDYVDKERIGVFGWSYGGFMTTSLMTHHPEAFKVGVAGGPVIDWSNYEVMYGERYMDTPAENPKGYRNTNLCNHAKNLKGRLLMIHGGQDPTVVWQHSQKFATQCVKDGVPLDYFVYPNHGHNVRGHDRVHLMAKISQYFDDFLK